MSQPIQLLPGFSIHFAGDGTWLYFEGENHKGGFCMESTLIGRGQIASQAVKEWIEKIRNNPIGM